jgi:hypothetical protein
MSFAKRLDAERQLQIDAIRAAPEFTAFRGVPVTLPPAAFLWPALLGFALRHELEAAWLARRGVAPGLAAMAAARAAAQFIMAEADGLAPADRAALPAWVPGMAGDVAPAGTFLSRHFGAGEREVALLRAVWGALGTAEALMETGGDIRLARDPRSALNGYGCSHRSRPWAVTFASSTASSSSERGYAAADRARLRVTLRLLRGAAPRLAVRGCLQAVRRGLARAYGLDGESCVVLAASGTDTELLALALTHIGGDPGRPICNILLAPEETGRGVPMAARGVHFAVDTALGHDVTFESPIAGFRPDTALRNIALRAPGGGLRAMDDVEAEIARAVGEGLSAGRRVIVHALDLSKTGLLAPRVEFLGHLRARFGAAFDIVVDACQARLSPTSVRGYLALDAVVLVTGSKFFTGPPFAGAALLPPAVARRLDGAALPAGLDAYFGRDEFPLRARAAAGLPPVGNYGLALRWHAALAEMRALLRVPAARRTAILDGFAATVRMAVSRYPALMLLDPPAVARHPDDEPWERRPSIFTFLLKLPGEACRCLTPAEARKIYLWLNTDLSPWLPGEAAVAARICHIGQPVPLPQPDGNGLAGALRVSAGARLISGEPSHRGLQAAARLRREFDDLAMVFAKIDLILRHFARLDAAAPEPRYRPAAFGLTVVEKRLPVA